MAALDEFRRWLVVEVAAGFGAASLAGKLFADLGCTVAKLALPDDDLEDDDPSAADLAEMVSLGKHSVALCWTHAEAAAPLGALLGAAEVLVVDRAGLQRVRALLASDTIVDTFPQLTVCACTPFGLAGPLSAWTGGEEVVQAVSGIMSITGHPGDGPTRVAGAPLTHAASMFAVTSALADVLRKRSGATGALLDVAVYDAAVAFESASLPSYFLNGVAPAGIGNRHSMSAPWNSFRCADGWVIVCGGNHPNWVRLCETIGRTDLLDDPRYATQEERIAHVDALEGEITAWTLSRPVAEVERLFTRATIAAGSVMSLGEVMAHRQFLERGLVASGSGGRQAGALFHIDRQPLDVRAAPWQRGAGTRKVLVERCRVAGVDYERWREQGIVGEEARR